jgi:hypothetical protein
LENLSRYKEQVQILEKAMSLQTPEGDPILVSQIEFFLSSAYLLSGQVDRANEMIRGIVSRQHDPTVGTTLLRPLYVKAVSMFWVGNFQEALSVVDQYRALSREMGYSLMSIDEFLVVYLYWGLGKYDEAIVSSKGCTHLAAGLQIKIITGAIDLLRGNAERACQEFELAISKLPEVGDTRLLAWAQAYASIACYRCGNLERSRELLRQALLGCQQENVIGASNCLFTIAFFLLERGEVEQALEYYSTMSKFPCLQKLPGRVISWATGWKKWRVHSRKTSPRLPACVAGRRICERQHWPGRTRSIL